jgi:outer membrane protein OmpA-like peptidoglycan-associated protein
MATDNSSNNSLASSMTDLMTSLAIIFILLLVASLNNAQQEGEQTRNDILLKLQEQLSKELVEYRDQGFELTNDPKDPLGLILVVPEGLLNFEVNKANIPQPGVEFLNRITPKLADTVCSDEFRADMNSIVVEGHTDSTGTDETNLPLSQARSMSVVGASLQILKNMEMSGIQSNRRCFLDLISATGRGSVEPLLDEGGFENLARSRRVVFKIRVRSLEQKVVNRTVGAMENNTTPNKE